MGRSGTWRILFSLKMLFVQMKWMTSTGHAPLEMFCYDLRNTLSSQHEGTLIYDLRIIFQLKRFKDQSFFPSKFCWNRLKQSNFCSFFFSRLEKDRDVFVGCVSFLAGQVSTLGWRRMVAARMPIRLRNRLSSMPLLVARLWVFDLVLKGLMIGLDHFLEIGLYKSIILATKESEFDDQEGGMNDMQRYIHIIVYYLIIYRILYFVLFGYISIPLNAVAPGPFKVSCSTTPFLLSW